MEEDAGRYLRRLRVGMGASGRKPNPVPEEGLPLNVVEPGRGGWTHAGSAEEESRAAAAESEKALGGSEVIEAATL